MRPPGCDRPPSDDGTTSPPPAPAPRPTLVHDDGGAAFLDAPGIGADNLFRVVRRVLGTMAGGAILTVFTDRPGTSAAVAAWCTAHDVELVAVIAHETGGETLALRRAGTA